MSKRIVIALGGNALGKTAQEQLRLVTETALRRRARSVLLAHCHVSGLAVPSPEDRIATLQCMDVLDKLQIELLDHLVFADGDYVSMAQSGLLRR